MHTIFSPAEYGYNSLVPPDSTNSHLVCVAKPQDSMTFREFCRQVPTDHSLQDYIFKHPDTQLFQFDQVLNDSHIALNKAKSAARGVRSKSKLSSATSCEPRKLRQGFYQNSLAKERLLKVLEYGLGSTPRNPQLGNFCYVHVAAQSAEPRP